MKNVVRFLSTVAVIALLVGGYIGTAHATGTNSIAEISDGVHMVGDTIRSTEVTGTIGWIVLAFLGIAVIAGHLGGGFIGLFVGLIGLGFWFGAQQIAETFGWRAIGL